MVVESGRSGRCCTAPPRAARGLMVSLSNHEAGNTARVPRPSWFDRLTMRGYWTTGAADWSDLHRRHSRDGGNPLLGSCRDHGACSSGATAGPVGPVQVAGTEPWVPSV